MRVFLDTSALVAVADRNEERHALASERWLSWLEGGWTLVTHNYVAVELMAVLHRRLGKGEAVLQTADLLAPVEVRWITPTLHGEAVAAYRESEQQGVSIVDHVSFAVMRSEQLTTAFAFDEDFRRAGFETVPTQKLPIRRDSEP